MTTTTSAEADRQADRQAFDIATRLGLAVVPGHYVNSTVGDPACSCGVADCAEPGAHPVDGAPVGGRRSALLPLGRHCDALDVPARTGAVGLGYLRLWAVPLGPVIEYPGRMVFLVAPEVLDDPPGLMVRERLGDPRRGIRYRDEGYLPLPPSDNGTPGEARWAVLPEPDGSASAAGAAAVRLPAAAELLGALAYAGHQLRRTAGRPVTVPAAR